jgi:hypothetical protein
LREQPLELCIVLSGSMALNCAIAGIEIPFLRHQRVGSAADMID